MLGAASHPLTQPGLGLLIPIYVCCIDEVAAASGECVEQGKRATVGHAAHHAGPGVADLHGTKLKV